MQSDRNETEPSFSFSSLRTSYWTSMKLLPYKAMGKRFATNNGEWLGAGAFLIHVVKIYRSFNGRFSFSTFRVPVKWVPKIIGAFVVKSNLSPRNSFTALTLVNAILKKRTYSFFLFCLVILFNVGLNTKVAHKYLHIQSLI